MTLIDVIIPTRDRPEALVACLEALARQTVQDFHVIVVDDGSTSPVADAIPEALRKQLRLTVLRHPTSRGPAAARNRAIRHGSSPCVAFVDDDVRCAPDTLARHLETVRAGDWRSVSIGPLSAPPDWEPTPWNLWEARQVQAEYDRMSRGEYVPTWRQFHTGNAFLTRKAIEAAGLFDERFTRAEDVEFALRVSRLGQRFTFSPDAIGWHYSYRTLDAWLRIPRAYAEFDIVLDRRYPRMKWLATLEQERSKRHPVIRAARAASAIPGMRSTMVGALTWAASTAFKNKSLPVAMGLLSIAYDLEYSASQRRALRASAERSATDLTDEAAVPTERVSLP
jgi:GT2 family glycosyltransferase